MSDSVPEAFPTWLLDIFRDPIWQHEQAPWRREPWQRFLLGQYRRQRHSEPGPRASIHASDAEPEGLVVLSPCPLSESSRAVVARFLTRHTVGQDPGPIEAPRQATGRIRRNTQLGDVLNEFEDFSNEAPYDTPQPGYPHSEPARDRSGWVPTRRTHRHGQTRQQEPDTVFPRSPAPVPTTPDLTTIMSRIADPYWATRGWVLHSFTS
jgi:hypothetical protein